MDHIRLHDYVPFYFGVKTPMVACNQDHNDEIAYLQFSTNLLQTPATVISDGNARSGMTKFQPFTQLSDLSILDVKAIQGVKYGADPELK